jgi:hypothetical protein
LETLYHYCSTSTFHSIVSRRSIRLSALSLSNDALEGKVVARAVARRAERDKLDKDSQSRPAMSLQTLSGFYEGLGFCLSEADDLLSQWRGYADDAFGLSIGFSVSYFTWLRGEYIRRGHQTFSVERVKYEPHDHEAEIEQAYRTVSNLLEAQRQLRSPFTSLLDTRTEPERKADEERWSQASKMASTAILGFMPSLYTLKSDAFREEKEWRLLTSFFPRAGETQTLPTVEYRATRDRLIPFSTYELLEPERHPIADVVLGPRNATPEHLVVRMLEMYGFGTVTVRRSVATYR